MAVPRISASAYQKVTLAALWSLAFIVITGAAVRLTGSGLGCPDWPTCTEERLVAPLEYHAMVEFLNRTVTGLVSVAVMLAVLGSLVRVPRRRDLVWLSLGLVAGVAGQIVLGGLTVLFELAPPLVMGHFLLSMVLLANATVLYYRAGTPRRSGGQIAGSGAGSGHQNLEVVAPGLVPLSRVLVAATVVVLVTGTVVTGAGPHGGDEHARRLDVFVPDAARVHGISVVVLLALTLLTLWRAHRDGAPGEVRRRGELLLAVLVAQAGVGYAQYFTGVPVVLVALHVAGAVAVWVAVVWFALTLTASEAPAPRRASPASRPAETIAT